MNRNIIWIFTITVLISISFTLVIYADFFSEKEIIKVLENGNYYKIVQKNTLEELYNHMPRQELKKIYESYITDKKVKKDVLSLIKSYFEENDNKVKQEFADYLKEELKEYDINESNLKSLITELSDIYVKNLFPTDRLAKVEHILPFKTKITKVASISLLVTTIVVFVSFFFVKHIYIADAILATAIVFVLPKVFIYFHNFVKNFYYYNNSFSYFIKTYFYQLINLYFKVGLLLFIIGGTIFLINIFLDKKVDLKS